jgi:hypothetical protein
VSQDKDPKPETPTGGGAPPANLGSGTSRPPPPPRSRTVPPIGPRPAPAAREQEVEEISAANLVDDEWDDLAPPAPAASAGPPQRVSAPPPGPRATLGGASGPEPDPGPAAPRATGPFRAGVDVAPKTRPFPFAVPDSSSSPRAMAAPPDPPTERSLPSERPSEMELPRGWGGAAAEALRDVAHKAGDSLRPAAHALREAVPKIRESLHPAAQAIREALPRIAETLRPAPHRARLAEPSQARSEGGAPVDSAKMPPWLLLAFAGGGLLLGVAVAVPIGRALRGSRAAARALAAPASSQALDHPTARTAATTCKVAGPPRVIASRAAVTAGVEARPFGAEIAVGYAASDKEGVVVRLDPGSLSTLANVTAASKGPIRRVTPIVLKGGGLGVAMDADRRGDVARGRRAISTDPPLWVGASGGQLVWTRAAGGPVAGNLWPLEGPGDVESARGALGEVAGEATIALTFRHGPAIGVGLARGRDALTAAGKLLIFQGLGPNVGSPALALNAGVVLAAWADRAAPDAPWSLRVVHIRAGEPPGDPIAFVPPPGGKGGPTMAPSITQLPDKGFLLTWTEGPPSCHGVRAVTLAQDGRAVGPGIDLSTPGTNAGQAQAVVTSSGRGVVAFLEAAGNAFQLVAQGLACNTE